ncbi:DUF2185 domain-containing protein [Sphingomonas sp.]|uniref:immunity protein Imm33 domain-containing protein n=1 Tax=Sphingomonas sp. TaxID=28214 RepID=UPI0025ED817A|nr:DUF2185 domain-containing protein [Sphingomonas sp.]
MKPFARLATMLGRARRRWFGRTLVVDPRPIASEAPYTFYLPSENELLAIGPGDLVKVTIQSVPPSPEWGAERLWFTVLTAEGERLRAMLDNQPYDIPQLALGQIMDLPRGAVIDIIWQEGRAVAPPSAPARREYWDRCFVDDCVLAGRSPVDYLYREVPDMDEPDDRDPDSGWRLRGTDDAIADDKQHDLPPHYVALGAVLNRDDSWLHLIDAPIGSTFIRNAAGGFDAACDPDLTDPPARQ